MAFMVQEYMRPLSKYVRKEGRKLNFSYVGGLSVYKHYYTLSLNLVVYGSCFFFHYCSVNKSRHVLAFNVIISGLHEVCM